MKNEFEQLIDNEEAYTAKFGSNPEMPRPMSVSDFNKLIEASLESGEEIDLSFDPDVLS